MIVVVGNPVYDTITNHRGDRGDRVLSGFSTNSSLALARLGQPTLLVGRLSARDIDYFVATLQRERVRVAATPCEQSGGFELIYDAQGNRTLEILGVAAPIEHVPPEIQAAAAIILGPILQETPLDLIMRIRANSAAPLFLDPQGLLRRVKSDGCLEYAVSPELPEVAALCEVVKVNEDECRLLTGLDPREHGALALRRVRELGCQIAIVTLAEAGSLIDDGRRQLRIPAFPTDAQAPTGAGDTYLAGFVYSYLRWPGDLFRAGCYGAATASIWIESPGHETPVRLDEVERRVALLLAGRQELAV
jgi:sugar/nucleoside kinase (ribokinase family)